MTVIGGNSAVIIVGTCSLCGGAVVVPRVITVNSTDSRPVVRTCSSCGAHEEHNAHGPVVQMRKP